MAERVVVGLGSNIGDRLSLISRAVRELHACLSHIRCSRYYLSPPWGYPHQDDFINLVLVGHSEMGPEALVLCFKNIEVRLGRVPSFRNGPRVIDIDLLAYGELSFQSEDVEVPHPRLQERDFVLLPWNELWPDWRHPKTKQPLSQILQNYQKTKPCLSKATALLPPDTGNL